MMTLLFCGNRYKYEMENVARAHAQRFAALYTLLGGKS